MLVNHSLARAVEPLENAANEEIVEPVIEDVGVGGERGCGHDTSREVVYSHALRLFRHVDALPEENVTVPENPQLIYQV